MQPRLESRLLVQGQDGAPQDGSVRVLAALAAGDPAALEELMSVYWRSLTTYASRLLDDLDSAEDVVQSVFVRVWLGRTKWTAESIRGLLFTLTRNAALDELRRQRSRARIISISPQDTMRRPRTPAEQYDQDAFSSAVDRAIQDLPSRRREVFDLTYLRGLSYQEVATVMGISPKTVGNQMTAALRQLRKVLRPILSGNSEVETDAVPSSRLNATESQRPSGLLPTQPTGR